MFGGADAPAVDVAKVMMIVLWHALRVGRRERCCFAVGESIQSHPVSPAVHSVALPGLSHRMLSG